MRVVLFWTAVAAAVAALAWWRNPRPPLPDLGAFEDGGRAVLAAAPRIRGVPRIASVHAEVALRMVPVLGGFLLVSLAAGLFRRERAAYASPSLAWIGKRTGLGGIALMALFAAAPLGWPMWTPYAAAGIAGVGVAVYAGNLPRRL